ncbi:MAG: ABC transporter substrate-binding protein [Actinomycetota bacterium]
MRNRAPAWLRLLVTVFAFALIAAACVSSEDDEGADTETESTTEEETPAEEEEEEAPAEEEEAPAEEEEEEAPAEEEEAPPALTASWTGVTEDTIQIGVTMLDFEALVSANLSAQGWGDQIAVTEALVAEVNDNGGINGRMLEVVAYEFYDPTDPTDAERACAAVTQDNEVFANVGGFLGPAAGTADPCIVGANETIMVGGEITRDEYAQAVAPWYQAGLNVEFQTQALFNLIVQEGLADDARAFVMGGANNIDQKDFVIDGLAAAGIEVVGEFVIEANDGDTIGQDSESAIGMERFQAAGANTLVIFGNPGASIRGAAAAGLTGEIAIWNNNAAGLNNLGATITDKSVADGVITSTGPTEDEIWDRPDFQEECVAPVAERVPEADLRRLSEYEAGEERWFSSVRLQCQVIEIFVAIATAAGPELTHDSFRAGADSLTDFSVPVWGPSSLGPDKPFAQDVVRLGAYDSTVGTGQIVAFTELTDAFE